MLSSEDARYFIRKIRHEHTNYDKLAAFYSDQKHFRKELNRTIGALLAGKIDIPEFRAKVAQIERKVDIRNNPKARKNFIKYHRNMLLKTGFYTVSQANAIAKHNIKALIKVQNACESEYYRPDLYETDTQKQL